jgi:DNA polymerase sigma
MENVMSLSGARVPIVKFTDPESGYSCDICINNTLALQNTQLLACYSNIDPRLKKLACVIKYWAKRRQINAPFAGTLSSYAYVLLLIHFLQRRNPPILPCLQTNVDHLPRVEVEGYDCTYHTKVHRSFSSQKNKQSTGKLLVEFFRFYGLEFDYVNCVVSVRTGGFFTKEAKDWKKPKHVRESCFLGLEDPFEVTHNLGRVVDKRGIEIIRNELERGFIILARKGDIKRVCKEYKEDDQDCGWR